MADKNVPAPAPIRSDDHDTPFVAWVAQWKANYVLDLHKEAKESIFPISRGTFLQTTKNFFRAFTGRSLALEITPVDQAHQFVSPLLGEAIMDFVNDWVYRGYSLLYVSRMAGNNLSQLGERYYLGKCYHLHLGRIINIHQRATSPFILLKRSRLGNLKFVPKGEEDKVFGMPIPNELISNNIRNAPYYNAYLEMVAKHDQKVAAEKEGKKKSTKEPAHSEPEPEPKQEGSGEEYDMERVIRMSLESFQAQGHAHVRGLAIQEPVAEAIRPLPIVEAKASEEASTGPSAQPHDDTSANIVRDSPSPENAETRAESDKTNSGGDTKILKIAKELGEDVTNQVNLEEKTVELDQDQARSDPVNLLSLDLNQSSLEDPLSQPGLSRPKNNLVAYAIGDHQYMINPLIGNFNGRKTSTVEAECGLPWSLFPKISRRLPLFLPSSHQLQNASRLKHVKEAVQIALQAPLRDRFRDLSEEDMKEMLHQKRDEFLAEKDKSRKRQRDDQDPPPPLPDLNLNKRYDLRWALVHKARDPQSSARTMFDFGCSLKLPPSNTQFLIAVEQPATLEPAWVIPTSHIPDAVNNRANALATTYQAPAENSLLEKTGDMRTFMNWYCQKMGKTELTQADLEDQIDWANPEGDQVRIDISKPMPLSGLPGHVTMKAARYHDFGLELLVPEHMWIDAKLSRMVVRNHRRISGVVRIKSYSHYGYDYLKEITLRRSDHQEYMIAEKDFKNLYPSDFEDRICLLLQCHLIILPGQTSCIAFLAGNPMRHETYSHDQPGTMGIYPGNNPLVRVEVLGSGPDWLQKAVILQEDANSSLDKKLPLAWNNIALIMRNKSDLDTMSMDDLKQLEAQSTKCTVTTVMKFLRLAHRARLEQMILMILRDGSQTAVDMLPMRGGKRFLTKNEVNLTSMAKQTVGFDKTKESGELKWSMFQDEFISRTPGNCLGCSVQDGIGNKVLPNKIIKTLMEDLLHLLEVLKEVKSLEKVKYDVPYGTEFKNNDMNQFCGMKGIKREFSGARTLQQNEVAKRKNRSLIEATWTVLADSLLPTTFWAEALNTACYVQNRVLVTKPHNKTPYELLLGRPPSISFMRPFGCPVTILNTLDPLGKFNGKAAEGKVEENLYINFLKNKPNVTGSGPEWLFDIDSLTKSMNYEPVTTGNQTNGDADKGDDDCKSKTWSRKDRRSFQIKKYDQHVQAFRIELDTFPVLVNRTKSIYLMIHVCNLWKTLAYLMCYDDREVGAEADLLETTMNIEAMQEELLQFKLQKAWTLKKQGIKNWWLRFQPKKKHDMIRYQLDMKRAFLYGNYLNRRVMCATPGLKNHSSLIRYRRGTIDKTLFIKKDRSDILLVQVYVNDINFGSIKKSLCVEFEQMMHKRFQKCSGLQNQMLDIDVESKGVEDRMEGLPLLILR
ncbi:putative ribonuclease H-like domain-containing protein [Tanacetum coccineum]|uniref:Ribonuclease H-like domain-containing protein n=1 Tax=Tanacetum coccineum TaxID=301880 RepID=A0ABQ5AEK8_9ASTR